MAGEITLTVVGNLVADPALRFTQSGAAVAGFTVASTPRFFDKASGQWQDGDAVFLRCSAWRQLGENVAESFRRGDRVVVMGTLKQRSYETSEGEKRTVMELTAEEVAASVKFRTVEVKAAQRQGGGGGGQARQQHPLAADADPWGSEPQSGFGGEPPF